MKFYRMNINEVLQHFKTDAKIGLTLDEVEKRLKKYGQNILPKKPRESWFSIFLRQFKNPLVYILLVAAAIIFMLGEDKFDAFIISGILFFNAIIGAYQEGRTRTIIERLQRFLITECMVIRDSEKILISNSNLVPGDIVLLQAGERVPADVRIIEEQNLCIDESALTGESICAAKNSNAIDKAESVADQNNMAFKGTYILRGSGKGIVVATGKKTKIGSIQRAVEEMSGILPLARELKRLSTWILIFVFMVCLFLFGIGLFTHKPLNELLVILTALFICVIPEGLPIVLTLVLVSGVYRMAKRNILVKNMQAVEALGRTDVIVIDKTGTLTRNEMMVVKVFDGGEMWRVSGQGYHTKGDLINNGQPQIVEKTSSLAQLAYATILLNRSEINYSDDSGLFTIKGDPTEAALYVFGKKISPEPEPFVKKNYKLIYEIPFDSKLNYHAGFYMHNNEAILYVIGAPEFILKRIEGPKTKLSEQLKMLLEQGLRVVGVGMKKINLSDFPSPDAAPDKRENKFRELAESGGLRFLGLCAIQDAIRPEVKPIIDEARKAGLEIIMATGDHKQTALYVAREVGIFKPRDKLVNGAEFEKMSDSQLKKQLDDVTVYARVSPEHKLKIIKLFHENGKIVAMTGDGINDVPSLVAADLGIAMGKIGSDVAKEASDIILLDDSFVHVIRAIEEGGHIFYTIRRVVLYFFSTNMAEILIILCALLLSIYYPRLPLPITAAQILWLNFVTDGFLDVALSTEPIEPDILANRRLKQKLRLIDGGMLFKMVYMAVPMAIGSMWVFMNYYKDGLALARTMTLITMAMFQWFNAWNCRSEERSIFRVGWFSNRWLIGATIFVLLLQFAVVNVPFMRALFKTVPLSVSDWAIAIGVSSSIIFIEELRKAIVRKWNTRYN